MEVENIAAAPGFDLPQIPASFCLELDSTVVVDSPVTLRAEASSVSPKEDPSIQQESDANKYQDSGLQEERHLVATAAVKLQKVYRGYRTRRMLADSVVVAEELWWQAIDFARLNHSTISFFNYSKPESATSKFNRVALNASKVGKGSSKDARALMLAFQHWIEAIDPRHRYGHNLHYYYDKWCQSDAGEPFFYWLDVGDGRNVNLEECPRTVLREQVVKYLGPQERECYEYIIFQGKITHKQTGEPLDTAKGSGKHKWIFVMSTYWKLYAGEKKKGMFHHSSFLAGGTTIAAGRLAAENGILKSIWAYSGHYRPSEENFNNFISFLTENGIDRNKIQISMLDEDYYEDKTQTQEEKFVEDLGITMPPELELPINMTKSLDVETTMLPEEKSQADKTTKEYKRSISGGLKSPRADVPQTAILQRIKSKEKARSFQLGHQLSLSWSTGAGPRIGCAKDYPLELRVQALEFVNLSPRVPTPSSYQRFSLPESPIATVSATCSLPSMS